MNLPVSSSKRKYREVVEQSISRKHTQPRVYAARDYPKGCGPVQQADYLKCDSPKVLKGPLSDVLLSAHEKAKDRSKSLLPISDTSVELKELPCRLELTKLENMDLVPPLWSLEHKDLKEFIVEGATQLPPSVHMAFDEHAQFLMIPESGPLKARKYQNLELSRGLKEANTADLQTFLGEESESDKKNWYNPTADEMGTQQYLDASDVIKVAKELDEHTAHDVPSGFTEEKKPNYTEDAPCNESTLCRSNVCNFHQTLTEDCLKIQPSLITSARNYEKYTPRKIVAKRSYPRGCGIEALVVKVEANRASTKLCSVATPRTKFQLDFKANTSLGIKFGAHEQKSSFLLKKKVQTPIGKDRRPAGSVRRPFGLDRRHFIEAESKRTARCQGSSRVAICTQFYKKEKNNDRKINKEIIAREKIKDILRLFHILCRKFLQVEEQSKICDPGKSCKKKPVHNEAFLLLKEKGLWLGEDRKWLGRVPGILVGDEFRYRIELCLTGLHPPPMAGIACKKIYGNNVATSVVSSWGYNDFLDSSDVLVYEGEGGHSGYQKYRKSIPGDQKLERGNLALANSIAAKLPVRVIHGFRDQSNLDIGNARSSATYYVYDGLYMVEHYWSEMGNKGFSVFKFRLKRMPDQRPLPHREILMMKQRKTRRIGLCIEDISDGKEAKPVTVVNTIDRQLPMPFIYQAGMKYPPWYKRTLQKGCNCTGKCSDTRSCTCMAKNGNELPFNYDGAIVRTQSLVYECGPHCSCPRSCYNRVSQHGIKFPLEVFKTKSRGWGVRSLASIPSGSFVCEYTGELLSESEAQKRTNDEYMFQIGNSYNETLWEDLSTCMPELQDHSCGDDIDDSGYTIDASRYGSVARFINHSCSPNLYAQNVLYDHDDKNVPHIMLFAVENIPPLTELCYHYHCNIGQVYDINGNLKEKTCYCGSSQCSGRLY